MRYAPEIEVLEYIQRLQRREALRIGRRLVDGISMVGGRDRIAPEAAMLREILGGQITARGRKPAADRLRDLPFIEGVPAAFRQQGERPGQLLLHEPLPGL
ncbi:hypothetical protein D3C71_994860 [compost metagenome]